MTDGGLPPQPHSDHLTLLEATLDAMSATNLGTCSVAELLDRACRLQKLSARIDAARAAVLAAADTASEAPGVLRELGFRTASQVVAAETGAPAREIQATARTGQWLHQFPLFAQAAAEGVLTLRHVRELKSLDRADRRDALVASQHELVGAARDHDFVEFTNRVTVWLINHTTSDEVQEQVKKTSCTWDTNTDGSIDGRFHLDPLSAAAVGTGLGDEPQRHRTGGGAKPSLASLSAGPKPPGRPPPPHWSTWSSASTSWRTSSNGTSIPTPRRCPWSGMIPTTGVNGLMGHRSIPIWRLWPPRWASSNGSCSTNDPG